jgi:hypothetical protein
MKFSLRPSAKRRFAITASVLMVAGAAASSAVADDDDIHWDAQGNAHRTLHLEPGKVAEYCGELSAHEKVQWQFDATSPLDFNIHFHTGGEVSMPAKADGVAASKGILDPASAQDYCWMWTSRGTLASSIEVSLKRLP